jgi:5-formyltetrahydrofolate cyclo-ligase
MGTGKDEVRLRMWAYMEDRDIARFPRPVRGRIPNFVGAEEAARRAARLAAWRKAEVIKANPDSPQRPLRQLALEEGKRVYMAVPRLREARCFVALDPRRLRNVRAAASIKGAFRLGERVHPRDMRPVDLVAAGSVAVNRRGARVGKGGGYSDLEFALARHFRLVDDATPILTTVHACQVVEDDLPMDAHDAPVDLIVTPQETIHAGRAFPKPRGILWHLLTEAQIATIPVLRELRGASRPRDGRGKE